MKLTTKGRFAVTAMLDLATHSKDSQPVTLAAISARQKISQSYLEQLFAKLRRAKLVDSVRGPGGGYILLHPIDKITITAIIAAVEDTLDATQCGGAANCQNGVRCISHYLWENLNRTIDGYLTEISLDDVLNHRFPAQTGMYAIQPI
ncbi:MAG: Rrf2 family transcriptional regulator [Neisseria sp.]|nr:Rrf2 family transcriptional regulator [Neisseria sp.]